MDLSMNAAPRVPLSHTEWSGQTSESLLVYSCRVNLETRHPPSTGTGTDHAPAPACGSGWPARSGAAVC